MYADLTIAKTRHLFLSRYRFLTDRINRNIFSINFNIVELIPKTTKRNRPSSKTWAEFGVRSERKLASPLHLIVEESFSFATALPGYQRQVLKFGQRYLRFPHNNYVILRISSDTTDKITHISPRRYTDKLLSHNCHLRELPSNCHLLVKRYLLDAIYPCPTVGPFDIPFLPWGGRAQSRLLPAASPWGF